MPYTKGEYKELSMRQAYRNPNEDNFVNIHYADAYLSAAANYVITKQYYIDIQEEGGGKEISGLFYATYEDVPVVWYAPRGLYYVAMPQRMLALPKDRGLPYIGPMSGEGNQYPLMGQGNVYANESYLDFLNNSFAQIEGEKIWLRNHKAVVDKVLIKMVISVDDLGDDDIVPIPAGMELDVINLIADFLMGRRQLPQDKGNNNREDN